MGDDSFIGDDGVSPRKADLTAMELAAIFSVDLGQFTPFVSVGYENSDLDVSGSDVDGSNAFKVTMDDDGFFYSVGLDYDLNQNVAIRFEMTYDEFVDTDGEELDIETMRLGVVRQF